MYSKDLAGLTSAQDAGEAASSANFVAHRGLLPATQAQEKATLNILPSPHPLKSEVLLGGKKELHIEHAGEIYKLRLTSLGKLILTK